MDDLTLLKYKELCRSEESIPLFSQAWWLDAVAGPNNWMVALVEKGGRIDGALPYFIKKKYGFIILVQPPLTQTLGPWIRNQNLKESSKLSYEKEIMDSLIDRLPKFHHFSQNWSPRNQNWLPFYWKGFQQTTKYTYVLKSIFDIDKIWSQMDGNIRAEIRKAESRFNLKVRDDLSVDQFIELNEMTFNRQGISVPYSKEFVQRLDNACGAKGSRRIFIAQDADGRMHGGVFLVWDKNSAYYLMGGADPSLRNSGAVSLCMWEAIKFASGRTQVFDFEGSMIEGVERFVRAFGATQTPYFKISKTPSLPLKIYKLMSEKCK
jgi:lipid II:glycine glycyltransferase (peptidoglycan interpeptide bridge formation enzyme)